jgi:acyl-coenzyme A thioesterase PaaI-like protein
MPIIQLPCLQLQTIEVGDVEIQMPYQDKLTFAPAAYQAGAIGTIMDVAASGVVLHY